MFQTPILTTERSTLRPLQPNDSAGIFTLRSHPLVLAHIDIVPAKTIDDAKAFMDKIMDLSLTTESYYWVIADKETDVLLGTICLWRFSEDRRTAEVGYALIPEAFGKGLAREALAAILSFGFESLGLSAITAGLKPENTSSLKVLSYAGFTYVGMEDNYVIYEKKALSKNAP